MTGRGAAHTLEGMIWLRRAAGVSVLALTGCRAIFGMLDPTTSSGPVDAADDAHALDAPALDAPAICTTWHPRHFDACAIPAPPGPLSLDPTHSPYVLNTTTGTLSDMSGTAIPVTTMNLLQAGGVAVRLVSVSSLEIQSGAQLDTIGDRPLLIASWSTISIDGGLDAGSHRGGRIGPGADQSCGALAGGAGMDGLVTGGSGGGAGGSHRGMGSAGGIADAPQNVSGGVPLAPIATPTTIRAGCNGGNGGKAGPATGLLPPATSTTFTGGGHGGGAIELAALTSIAVNGTVIAGGGGGDGSIFGAACGGGGGGSGGYIGLDAPQVTIGGSASVAANGGSGAGGAPFAQAGNPGSDATPSLVGAPGGAVAPGGCGPAGGSGGAIGNLNGGPVGTPPDVCSSGGGGGGVGFLLIWSPAATVNSVNVSPMFQINPT